MTETLLWKPPRAKVLFKEYLIFQVYKQGNARHYLLLDARQGESLSTSETKLKVPHGPSPNQLCAALENPDLALPLFAGRHHILSQLKNPTGKLEMPGAEAGE